MGKNKDEQSEMLLTWFRESTSTTTDEKKIEILNKWIEDCSNEEEFLLACNFKSELDSIKRRLRIERKKKSIIIKVIRFLKNLF